MFVTTNSFAFPMPHLTPDNLLADRYWRAVEISNPLPLFLMTIRQTESHGKRRSAVYTTRNVMLLEVTEAVRIATHDLKHPIQFESVLIITPPFMNLTANWKMDPLAAVWTAPEPTLASAQIEICETESGEKYVTSDHQVPIEELKKQTLIFKFPVRQE